MLNMTIPQENLSTRFASILLISLLFFQCKNSVSFEPVQETNNAQHFAIYLRSLEKIKKVDSNWWGDDYYALELSIHNLTDQFIILNFFAGNQDELSLKYSLTRKEDIYEAFKANPGSFDLNYFTSFHELKLIFKIESESPNLESEYEDKKIFRKYNNDNYYLAPFVGSYYGVPLKTEKDIEINSSSGWIQPKSFNKVRLTFSLPAQGVPSKLIYGDVYIAELKLKK